MVKIERRTTTLKKAGKKSTALKGKGIGVTGRNTNLEMSTAMIRRKYSEKEEEEEEEEEEK